MTLVLVGLSHKTAGIALREKVVFSEQEQGGALATLASYESIKEAVIVSTCNRTEIYATAVSFASGSAAITAFLAECSGLAQETITPHLYLQQGEGVVNHLFRVVSSLDSLVLGEAQIQGQIRDAFTQAKTAGTTADLLGQLFRQALLVGKRVRSSTNIGANSVSLSTAAVTLARRVFEDIEGRSILIIGAGEMSELTVRYLYDLGARSVLVANRTLARARELAERFGGMAVAFDELVSCLEQVDIVISSTAAPGYVITPTLVHTARRYHQKRSLLLIDIALPRDIDPACNEINDVYVYDIDDLEDIVDLHRKERRAEAKKAALIVLEEVEAFKAWYQALSVKPTIAQIRKKANAVVEAEVERALKRMASERVSNREVLEAMANAIVKKVLHGPTARLNQQATNPNAYQMTEAARFLFGLDSNPEGQTCAKSGSEGWESGEGNGAACARYKDALHRDKRPFSLPEPSAHIELLEPSTQPELPGRKMHVS